jgi:hypothetical protein
VRLAIEIEKGCRWVRAEPCGAGLMRGAADGDVLAEVHVAFQQDRTCFNPAQHHL